MHKKATRIYYTTQEIQPIFPHNYIWSITFKNCESLYCTSVTCMILYINYVVVSCFWWMWLCAILWTAACQAPLSMGFSKAQILRWVATPSSRRSSHPGDQTCGISCLFWIAGGFFTTEPPRRPHINYTSNLKKKKEEKKKIKRKTPKSEMV